jgi:hypothetical protein
MRKSLKAPRLQRKRVFFGCEGDSEASYAAFLYDLLEKFRSDRHIEKESFGGGDHLAVVEATIEAIQRKERAFGRFTVRGVMLDADRRGENGQRDAQCDALIRRHGLIALWQRPCIEGLLVRHFAGNEHRNFPSSAAALDAIRVLWPSYRKPATRFELAAKLGIEDVYRLRQTEHDLDGLLRAVGFPERLH